MKNTIKYTGLALNAALALALAVPFAASAAGTCCPAASPTADKAGSDAKARSYPLDTCIVSDEKLGEMGKPYVFTHKGQEIKLCCKSCLKKFDKDPAKYLKKLKDAEARKAKDKV